MITDEAITQLSNPHSVVLEMPLSDQLRLRTGFKRDGSATPRGGVAEPYQQHLPAIS